MNILEIKERRINSYDHFIEIYLDNDEYIFFNDYILEEEISEEDIIILKESIIDLFESDEDLFELINDFRIDKDFDQDILDQYIRLINSI